MSEEFRLLIFEREYLRTDKKFPALDELLDYVATNVLLDDAQLETLRSTGEVVLSPRSTSEVIVKWEFIR